VVTGSLGGLAQAEIVLLAPPVLAIRGLMAELATHLAPGAIVTDAASTKADVERWALELLPNHVYWVGGHPMAGKETAGLEHASAELFQGRTWCIVPPPNAEAEAVRRVTQLAVDTGARPLEVDALSHDRAVAAVSHLPFTAAAALAATTITREDFRAHAAIAGTGLRDMTRLASGDPVMHRDICLTNRDNLVVELERYVEQLQRAISLLRAAPAPDDSENHPATADLGAYFELLKDRRDTWLVGR